MPYLSATQARLRDDIRGLIRGDVRCDEVTLQLYSTDAGLLQCRPQAVVWPKDVDDIVACVYYAAEKGFQIHARGSGTGTSGESLGNGIVLDFTRYMRRIVSLEREAVVVQPGILRSRLNTLLHKAQQRCFGPVCGFAPATTIGSILSRNGAGADWLRYGFACDHLMELKVVLASGDLLTLNKDSLPQAIDTGMEGGLRKIPGLQTSGDSVARGMTLARGIVLGKEHAVADEVRRVLTSPTSEPAWPEKPVEVDRAGYHCRDILKGEGGYHVDLARLLAGSEGTLGLIYEAKLKTLPLPRRGAAAVFLFNGLEKAVRAVEHIRSFAPVLCELVDRRRVSMVNDRVSRFQPLLPMEAEALLLLELDGGTVDENDRSFEARERLARLIDVVQNKEALCFQTIRIETPEAFDLFDDFRHWTELVLFQMQRSFQALPLFDDPAIPVEVMGDFVVELLNLLKRHEMTASITGHAGQGHFRIHPIIDLAKPGLSQTLRLLAEDVYALVLSCGGTISSEGGTGFLKSCFLPGQFLRTMTTFHRIKEVFDPKGLLNPGKVVPDVSIWTERLRRGLSHRGMDHPEKQESILKTSGILLDRTGVLVPLPMLESDETSDLPADSAELSSQLELQLKWEPQHIFESTYRCNGCGDCLRMDRSGRMCPLFKREATEEASPRAKANLLRGILEKELSLETLTSEDAKKVADFCFHCHRCEFECPADVDVAHLAFRCKSAYVAAHGLSLDDLFFSRIDSVLRWLAMISCPVNWSLTNRPARWLMEKILRIPQGRLLPKLAKVTFLGRARWSGRLTKSHTMPANKIALFVDTFVNHFDTELGDLAVRVLQYNGIDVHIPPRQKASGLTSFALGNMERAERLARHNTLLLADLIRQGYQIVTLEPASASCITKDYRYVIDDIDTALVTSNVVDLCDFLFQRHLQGDLRLDFKPMRRTVGYHAPCRSMTDSFQSIDSPTPAEELLRLIPELDVRRIERGCCGLAGTYGLKKKNHRRCLKIGLPLAKELRDPAIDFGASDCNSCRMQMENGSKKQTLHPIRLLAVAYGLTPDVIG